MFRLKKQGPIARFLTLAAILCAVWTSVCAAEAMPPVSYTAYTSLYWLWEAGVPEAAEFSEAARPIVTNFTFALLMTCLGIIVMLFAIFYFSVIL